MAIRIREDERVFSLVTEHSCYQMQADRMGVLLHLYYGRPVGDGDGLGYLLQYGDVGFSGNPYDAGKDRTYSLDCLPQEFSSCGVGDFRESSVEAVFQDGSCGLDLRYQGFEVRKGAYPVDGMPAAHDEEQESETLVVFLKDTVRQVEAELYYGVFPREDVITRAVRIRNAGEEKVTLNRVMSANVDFLYGDMEAVYLQGRHAMERSVERAMVGHAGLHLDSRRGTSSHQMNPAVILCSPGAGEENGECFSFQLVYSGSFRITVQKDQRGMTRLNGGIQPDRFCWQLERGECFQTPQAVLSYSADGMERLSGQLHRFTSRHICRGAFMQKRRPVLINNWEATYFDFNQEKLERIAAQAADLGIEMMVLDDGWFGKRDDDFSGLGDWKVNEKKLGGSMGELADKIHGMGMQFGLWFEPEMISEDSDLYREHPDWALSMPGRQPNRSRYQLVLDMSRRDVRDYLFEQISSILRNADINYVKWDMNRSVCDIYSGLLPAERQGEVSHRYVLGVYELMGRLTEAFPEVMFEGCSGGGGRFDLGILYYSPQIWCSDNTDAVNRTSIQYGTSLFYPVSAVGSHVSVCPNHQTGRVVPFHTRAVVAMAGSFGYEMDLQKLDDGEKEQVKRQVELYHKYYDLIHQGNYYRLSAPGKESFMAWQFVDEEREKSLVNIVMMSKEGNPVPCYVRLKGLEPGGVYRLEDGSCLSGSALMYAGYPVPAELKEYDAVQIYLQKV